MLKIERIACLCLLVSVALLAGCDKSVKLVFINTTHEDRALTLSTPDGSYELGTLAPAGRRSHTVKLSQDDLPADCSWTAGDKGGSFTIDKKTKSELKFLIGEPSIGPLKKGDEVDIHRKTEVKDKPISEEPIIE